jgi:hypothetical protein
VQVLLNGGLKLTNASIAGIAGNAPGWTFRLFGGAGVVFARAVTVGVEAVQQPTEIDGFAGADVPATLAVFGRLTPAGGRFSAEIAFVRIVGLLAPDVDVKAVNRLLAGASVRF